MLKKLITALSLLVGFAGSTLAAEVAPEVFVRTISTDVLEAVKADKSIQSGDIGPVIKLVDSKVMPNVNFEVVTRSAVGPQWRGATPEQRAKLQAEFKLLLVRVYSGALTQVSNEQTVEVTRTQPVPGGSQVVVQSEVRGKGEPIKLDYRLDKTDAGWKIIDVNVGGIWLVTSYRSQFAQEINAGGIDGLIAKLTERNKAATKS